MDMIKKYFLQQNIMCGFDLICAETGKTVENNVDTDDFEFFTGTNFVYRKTDKNN